MKQKHGRASCWGTGDSLRSHPRLWPPQRGSLLRQAFGTPAAHVYGGSQPQTEPDTEYKCCCSCLALGFPNSSRGTQPVPQQAQARPAGSGPASRLQGEDKAPDPSRERVPEGKPRAWGSSPSGRKASFLPTQGNPPAPPAESNSHDLSSPQRLLHYNFC